MLTEIRLLANIHKAIEGERLRKEKEARIRYCPTCGARFKKGTDYFCPKCQKMDIQYFHTVFNEGIVELLKMPVVFVIIIVLAAYPLEGPVKKIYNGYKSVQEVKTSSPSSYDVTLEQSFDNFFGDPKWRYEGETDEYYIVSFTGNCTYLDELVTAKLVVWNYKESDRCSIKTLSFNDVPQTKSMMDILLTTVYEEGEQ